ncbi:hypothetical protein DEF23_26625, partial [Marinitenerispora sediminis]
MGPPRSTRRPHGPAGTGPAEPPGTPAGRPSPSQRRRVAPRDADPWHHDDGAHVTSTTPDSRATAHPLPLPPRLRPGTALYRAGTGRTVLRAADGELFEIALPDPAIAAVHAALTGPDGAGLPPELDAFAAAGHLGARPGWPAGRRRVGVVRTPADPGALAPLAAALTLAGAIALPLDPGDDPERLAAADVDALCWLHDGPAPRSWTRLDALADRGVAWQRISREGRHVLIEPVAARPGDVRHADVRARRLAAAGSGHRHLTAYWDGAAAGELTLGDE